MKILLLPLYALLIVVERSLTILAYLLSFVSIFIGGLIILLGIAGFLITCFVSGAEDYWSNFVAIFFLGVFITFTPTVLGFLLGMFAIFRAKIEAALNLN